MFLRILETMIMASIFLYLAMNRMGGIYIIFALLFLTPSFLHSAFICYKDRTRIKVKSLKAVIWLSVLIISSTSHVFMHKNARETVETVAQTVVSYKQTHGVFPESLTEAGIVKGFLRKERGFYTVRPEGPSLIYLSTFAPYESYSYNFETKSWYHNSD